MPPIPGRNDFRREYIKTESVIRRGVAVQRQKLKQKTLSTPTYNSSELINYQPNPPPRFIGHDRWQPIVKNYIAVGRIVNSSNYPLANILVTMQPLASGARAYQTYTNSDGYYTFYDYQMTKGFFRVYPLSNEWDFEPANASGTWVIDRDLTIMPDLTGQLTITDKSADLTPSLASVTYVVPATASYADPVLSEITNILTPGLASVTYQGPTVASYADPFLSEGTNSLAPSLARVTYVVPATASYADPVLSEGTNSLAPSLATVIYATSTPTTAAEVALAAISLVSFT